jgi:hypothetical protein
MPPVLIQWRRVIACSAQPSLCLSAACIGGSWVAVELCTVDNRVVHHKHPPTPTPTHTRTHAHTQPRQRLRVWSGRDGWGRSRRGQCKCRPSRLHVLCPDPSGQKAHARETRAHCAANPSVTDEYVNSPLHLPADEYGYGKLFPPVIFGAAQHHALASM